MNYKIKAIFPTEKEANSASSELFSAGFRKEFNGYTQNALAHPEALVEDHKIEKNSVTVFTPNLNRAFKAKNILAKIGAVSTKMKSGFSNKTLFEETKTAFTNLVGDLQQNLPRSQSRSVLKIGISEK